MTHFSIDPQTYAVTAWTELPKELEAGSLTFNSQEDLAAATQPLPGQTLVDVWNALAGVPPFGDLRPVKKFTDRKTGVARIWASIQKLVPVVPQDASEGRKRAAGARGKGKGKAKGEAAETNAPVGEKAATKQEQVLAMLAKGCTGEEIQAAMGWQPHTVRGFISGTVGKKLGLTVTSCKTDDGKRFYQLAS